MSDGDTKARNLLGPVLLGAGKAEPCESRSPAQATAEELLTLCGATGEAQVWDQLILRFHERIISTARRTAGRYPGTSTDLCEDLAQQVYQKLSDNDRRLLREFVPRHPGSAFAYLSVVTANAVHDYFKGKGRPRIQVELTDNVADLAAPSDVERSLLRREIDDLLKRHVSDTKRQIFWLHHQQGLTAKEIAALPDIGLSVKGVESVLKRLKDLLRDELGGGEGKPDG